MNRRNQPFPDIYTLFFELSQWTSMAIITEQIDPPGSPSKSRPRSKPKPKPESESNPLEKQAPSTPQPSQNPNPFTFWFYFTISVSIITVLFVFLSSFSAPDSKTWFLGLPASLRTHFSDGRPVKVQINPNEPPIEVFTYSKGPKGSETVLIVHGLGCSSFTFRNVVDGLASNGVFAVAVDLPGSGFSDKAVMKERERVRGGVFGRFMDIYDEIQEKGIFWGFDNLVEHGSIPFEEVGKRTRVLENVAEPIELGGLEVGRVLGQVIDSMGLAPLHLVLHDSALVMGSNWVVDNVGYLRSVTLIDTLPRGTAFPLWVFEIPVVREVVLGFDSVFKKLIGNCCSKTISGSSVEAHRVLLKGRDGRQAVVGIGKKLNQSFDLAEWSSQDGLKGLAMQVIWSEEWSEEGRRFADMVSQAKLVMHSGGKWPQDDTSSEIAETIASFVSSLPKTDRKANEEEPLPGHVQNMLDEAISGDSHRGQGHGHGAQAGYMDSYGLDQGQGQGQGHGWGM